MTQSNPWEQIKVRLANRVSSQAYQNWVMDWATADRIRDELTALNIVVMDGPTGATWRLGDSEPT